MKVSTEQARRFLLFHQGLSSPRQSGPQAVAELFHRLRTIQYDPINPCGNNVDLVLQSRLSNTHPLSYHRWLYQQRSGIEYYDKMLSIVPVEDSYLLAHQRQRITDRLRLSSFIADYRDDLDQLLELVRTKGPISAQDIVDPRRVDWSWSQASWGKAALEVLWELGQIVIVDRRKGKKYYHTPEAYTDRYTADGPSAIGPEHILRRLKAVGLLPASGSGGGWLGMVPARTVATQIGNLIQEGRLEPVTVEGSVKQYVIDPANLDALRYAPVSASMMRFIAPLDNLIWDRQMIKQIFNFDYTWEVYVPAPKRKFGYYVLPVLYKDKLIGRIEPVLVDGRLVIKGFWLEPATKWTAGLQTAYDRALSRFARYLGTQEIDQLVHPN